MKKLLIGLGIFVALVVILLIVAPFFIPMDTVKGRLVTAVKQSTGRDLTIGGPMTLSLIPSLGVEAHDVALSNAPGASTPNMAVLKSLEVKLKLLPLLGGTVVVDHFVLTDPQISLEIEKNGQPNWTFAGAGENKSPAAPSAPAATSSGAGNYGSSLSSLRLNDVRLVNGQVTYLDRRTDEHKQASDINMTLSLPSLDSPFTADGDLTWNNEKVSLTIEAKEPNALLSGAGSPATLKLKSDPVSFSFDGTLAASVPAKLNGAIDLDIPSIRELARWAGTPLSAPGTGFGPLSLKGNIDAAGPKMRFSNAAIVFDAMKGNGDIAVDTSGTRPKLTGQLTVDRLDVNPYLPPAASSSSSAPAASGAGAQTQSGASGWSDAPLDLSALKVADVNFSISAGAIQYRKIEIGKTAVNLSLDNGRMNTTLNPLNLYSGSGQGNLVVDSAAATPAVQMTFNLSGVEMEPLLHDAMNMDRLSGTGNVTFSIAGQGRSQRMLISSLNGKGALNLANGAFKGVNIVGLAKNAMSRLTGGSSSEDSTPFASLSGTFTIVNGVMHNNDLKLVSAATPMTGAGTIDLPQRTVDYKVTPQLAGVSIPVRITGPWSNLSYQPDLAGMVGNPAKLLGGAVGGGAGLVKKAPGNVGGALKGLFGQ